ncbi:unnamed protein product (macronuclear) [Paramecium tetraurelia]|uniref:RING-type domain-containing protein n=1 Tax=Paramecium tetraurelia TaxID=5888 RepID=A0CBM7_PARTE|nr:uncharacterized protein GSPATT00036977001 [Paramecium tetraurelia]CAK68194.1 unnamed protein product [Paramecium tetraurelia]|eukprot:XP_001435591.1 hypothetical protein (macronuclear) [Paramecium tetraurelia strain d4-2]
MQYTKENALKNVNIQNPLTKNSLAQKLLQWNSLPLINFEPTKLDIYFGVFLHQIIKSSQNLQLKILYQDIMNKIQFEINNKQHLYAELCRKITNKDTLYPFPDQFDFKTFDQSIQESLEIEICNLQFWQNKLYQSTKLQSKEPLQFKILFYQFSIDNNVKQLLIFSTNKNFQPRLQSFPIVSQFYYPNTTRATYINPGEQSNQNDIRQTNQYTNNISFKQQILPKGFFPLPQQTFNQSKFNSCASAKGPQEFQFNNPNQINPNFQFPTPNGFQTSAQIQGDNRNQQNNNFVSQYPYQRTEYQQQNIQFNLANQQSSANDDTDVFRTEQIATKESVVTNPKPQNEGRILTKMIQKEGEKSECSVCYENYYQKPDEAIMTPCCNKMAHKPCMLNMLNDNAKQQMNLETIRCYLCEKLLKEYQEFLRSNIPKQLIFNIKLREVLAKVTSKCCKCNSPIQASTEYKQVQIQCLKCNTILCRYCYQEYHGENQANQSCPNLLKEILKAIDGMPVLVCPFCGTMQTKDEKCNHVKCHVCQKDLCSACSVDRSPIMDHGNHYHRVGCPDYQPWIQNGKVMTEPKLEKRSCQKCRETGQACQFPISLEEYKQLKQF